MNTQVYILTMGHAVKSMISYQQNDICFNTAEISALLIFSLKLSLNIKGISVLKIGKKIFLKTNFELINIVKSFKFCIILEIHDVITSSPFILIASFLFNYAELSCLSTHLECRNSLRNYYWEIFYWHCNIVN